MIQNSLMPINQLFCTSNNLPNTSLTGLLIGTCLQIFDYPKTLDDPDMVDRNNLTTQWDFQEISLYSNHFEKVKENHVKY